MVCRKQISKYSHCSILFHFDTVYQKNYRIAIIKSEHRWHGCLWCAASPTDGTDAISGEGGVEGVSKLPI